MTDNKTETSIGDTQNSHNGEENRQQQWAELQPLSYSPPNFPIQAIPEPLRAFIAAVSEATQTPLDLAGSLVLAVIAAANSKYHVACFSEGWIEPLNLEVVVAMPPASRKSAVFNLCINPIQEYERLNVEKLQPAAKQQASEKRMLLKRQERLESELSKPMKADQITECQSALEKCNIDIENHIDITLPRFIADDITPEMLTSLLCEQNGKMAIMSAEGSLFTVIIDGLYSKGSPNFEVLLKAHSGDTIRVDRRGREPEYIKDPALTIGLAIQPYLLAGLCLKNGLKDRGLLGRFLYAVPESNIGFRRTDVEEIPEMVKQRYDSLIKCLLDKVTRYEENGSIARRITLSPAARTLFNSYKEEVEVSMRPGARFSTIQDWCGKLPGAVLRIAANLQLVCDANRHFENSIITYNTMFNAIKIGIYYAKHAIGVYNLMGSDPILEDAKYILARIENESSSVFSKRKLHQSLRGQQRFKYISSIDESIALLIERGYIRAISRDTSEQGRPPDNYEVNPALFGTQPEIPNAVNALEGFEDYVTD